MTHLIPFLYTAADGKSSITNFDMVMENKTFKSIPAPEFECAVFKQISIQDIASLNVTSTTNKARAGGVDTKNINGLCSEFSRGYRTDSFPPVLMILPDGTCELWDGYNRYSACNIMRITSFPIATYELKHEWANRIYEAYLIVSLGLNNHPQCKPATQQDFVTCGINMVRESKGEMTKGAIINWINQINNSWSKRQVETIANQIHQQTTVASNITPFPHPRDAHAWVSENIQSEESTLVVCCKETGYLNRAHIQIMKNYVGNVDAGIDPIETTNAVLYTKACETSTKVNTQRAFANNFIEDLDRLVLDYAKKREENPNHTPYQIIGAIPQLNGVEAMDSLVKFNKND
jgi:hypothetical protein